MGCDIHAYVEFKKPNRTEWDGWPDINLGRDYSLFGRMAGVRGSVTIFEPRGLPDGIAFWTRHEFDGMGGDAHTPSWLSIDEFERALSEVDRWEADPEYWAVLAAMKYFAAVKCEVRLVFWFDN